MVNPRKRLHGFRCFGARYRVWGALALLGWMVAVLLGCWKSPKPKPIMEQDGMVWIPAGTFRMEADEGDGRRFARVIEVDGFWMDKHEVTNAQYCAFLNEQGNQLEAGERCVDTQNKHCLISLQNGRFVPKEGFADHPVVLVSWHGASAYADWMGKRLPTELEWEYAARGGLEGKAYPWGNAVDHDQANYDGIGGNDRWVHTGPVGSFPPNGYGLYDMAGNVWEWCHEGYQVGYDHRDTALSATRGPHAGVLRGGSWYCSPDDIRCAYRNWTVSEVRWGDVGFRCVRSPSAGAKP